MQNPAALIAAMAIAAVSLPGLVVPAVLPLDGTGAAAWVFSIPNNGAFVGVRLCAQTLTIGGSGYDANRAIEARICP